jgi:subtilisin family serine protease
VPRFLLFALFAHTALAGVVSRDVVDRVREHGRARVIVLMRQPAADDVDGFAVRTRLRTVPLLAGDLEERAIARLESDPNVIAVDLDVAGGGGDAESLELIGADAAQRAGFFGSGGTVAVIDSGFDPASADLAGAVVDEQCFCVNSDLTGCCPNHQTTQSGSGAARDENGHGTNVAGIIASRGIVAPIGVAPGVKLVEVRVLDSQNRFSSLAQVMQALEWVAMNHPEVRVVNMSLLTDTHFPGDCDTAASYTQALSQLIGTMRAHGTAVFACSGNNGSSTSMGAPACVRPTISVGAVFDRSSGTADTIASFSDSDASLDLLGPGVSITSTGLGSPRSTYTGTSQATPHAAASAAVLFAMRPSLTVDEMESTLKSAGRPIVDARNGVTTPRVDLWAAIDRMMVRRRSARH